MGSNLTAARPSGQTKLMGRRPLINAKVTKFNMTPEDEAYIDAVGVAYGLNDRSAVMRFAVREIARRDRLKVVLPESSHTEDG